MKKDILKIAGVKSEAELYAKYGTEAEFMAKHGGAFKKAVKKAKMGAAMVKKQLTQLTDFANPPQAKVGDYIQGGVQQPMYQPVDIRGMYDNLDYMTSGKTNAMRAEEARLAQLAQQEETTEDSSGGMDAGQAMQLASMFMKRAGGNVPRYQGGGGVPSYMQFGPNLTTLDPITGQVTSNATGKVTQGQTQMLDAQFAQQNQQPAQQSKQPKSLATTAGGKLLDKGISLAGPLAKPLGQIVNAGRKVKQSIDQAAKARQAGNLASLTQQVSGLAPERVNRKYVRPEDNLVEPGVLNNPYGSGTNLLAKYGMQIGGNLTEIQNMYNPGDMYMDLGYEPLDDSNTVKQYRKGGKAAAGAMIGAIKAGAEQAGNAANIAGDVVSGIIDIGTENRMKRNQQILGQAAFQQGAQQLQQGQFNAFMEDGGEVGLKYLSHDWQPQVIAKFGEYDVNDLLAPPNDADMLRAGGEVRNIRSNYMGNDERLSMMQMGGELETYWGGDAETISYNPYLPDGGETIMFRGQSHDESDGQGRTGIGIKFGESPVEVERGEPAVKLKDGGTGEENLVVYGNMKIPSYGITELNDPKAKGKKFKTYVADLSKSEAKQNKIIDKNINLVNNIDGDNPFDMLKLASAKAMLTGADMKLKDISMKKQTAAGVQNAILDTAEEMGVESDALSKGKLKPIKNSDMAKFGAKMETAQFGFKANTPPWQYGDPLPFVQGPGYGVTPTPSVSQKKTSTSAKKTDTKKTSEKAPEREPRKELVRPIPIRNIRTIDRSYLTDIQNRPAPAFRVPVQPVAKESSLFDKAIDAYDTLYPYIKPAIRNPLDPGQLAGEMFALSSNQLEPVQAQTYQPMLEQVSAISLQDQLNEIQSQTNAAMRMAGGNPAAQAMIAAQASAAKNKVLGEQFRMNQAMSDEVRRRNIATLNDATLKNLAILDQQYTRQETAKSKTKAQAFEALSSIAEKIGKNKAETMSANVMANMYPNYTFGPKGRIFNTGVTKFNTGTVGDMTFDQFKAALTNDEKKEDKKGGKRNGSIVKAIKGL